MIDLFNGDTNAMIGSITENELKTLQDALEEESADDHDYFIDPATVDLLALGRRHPEIFQVAGKARDVPQLSPDAA